MKISVELPDTTSFAHLEREYLKRALVATLYHLGKISEKEACIALGVTRREFGEILPEFGFSVLADGQETIDVELSA